MNVTRWAQSGVLVNLEFEALDRRWFGHITEVLDEPGELRVYAISDGVFGEFRVRCADDALTDTLGRHVLYCEALVDLGNGNPWESLSEPMQTGVAFVLQKSRTGLLGVGLLGIFFLYLK